MNKAILILVVLLNSSFLIAQDALVVTATQETEEAEPKFTVAVDVVYP